MKKIILFFLVANAFMIVPRASDDLDPMLQSASHIVLGNIYYMGTSSAMVEVTWELKGRLQSTVIDLKFDKTTAKKSDYKKGDRVLIIVDRKAMKPFNNKRALAFNFSAFDPFNGQYAFRKIEKNDFPIVSDIYEKVKGGDLASAFTR